MEYCIYVALATIAWQLYFAQKELERIADTLEGKTTLADAGVIKKESK